MADVLKVACIQINGGAEMAENFRQAEGFIRAAAAAGARLVATPENTDRIAAQTGLAPSPSFTMQDHPGLPFFSSLARDLSIDLLVGSVAVRLNSGKNANRSILFGPNGDLKATYDKIHMFDVDLPTGESHRESSRIEPGDKAVVASMDDVNLGLSICYDLRFAYLYRDLAKARAQILAVPSAFTVPTGQAHWEVLLRARAIETGSFVIAPAQTGDHPGGRKTYGHSLIIGPWGQVLAGMGSETGFIAADLDMDDVARARQAIPALKHDRAYTVSLSGQ